MKLFLFWMKFHESFFLWVQLTVNTFGWCKGFEQTGDKPLPEPMLSSRVFRDITRRSISQVYINKMSLKITFLKLLPHISEWIKAEKRNRSDSKTSIVHPHLTYTYITLTEGGICVAEIWSFIESILEKKTQCNDKIWLYFEQKMLCVIKTWRWWLTVGLAKGKQDFMSVKPLGPSIMQTGVIDMMRSGHGNTFTVLALMWGIYWSPVDFPQKETVMWSFYSFFVVLMLLTALTNCCTNNTFASDLRCHDPHVMTCHQVMRN